MTDVRPFSPVPIDLALVRRLAAQQLVLDTTTSLTRDNNPLESALLAVVPLADLGLPTLVFRESHNGYIVQLRHRIGERCAHLASVAPEPFINQELSPWIRLIEAAVVIAGRRGAFMVVADVPESAAGMAEVLRRTGFLVYYRQIIFCHPPEAALPAEQPLKRFQVRPVEDADWHRLQSLYASLVPGLAQQVSIFPEDSLQGLVVETVQDKRLMGFLEYIEGKTGVLIRPTLHPDTYDEAEVILARALISAGKVVQRLPVYFNVRSYHEWLARPLQALQLQEGERQVVFVKHTVARVDHDVVRTGREVLITSLTGNVRFENK